MKHYDALETRNPQDREAALMAALPAQIANAQRHSAAFAEILNGVEALAVNSRAALSRLPVTRKYELLARQQAQRATDPFGGFATIGWKGMLRPSGARRVYQSPGPIYEPEGVAQDYWRAARAMAAAGFEAGDLVHNCFSYHLTPGAWIMESGAHALGCTVIPGGVGNTEQQLAAIADLRPVAYSGTPSFLKILIEKAAEAGQTLSITKAMVSGEACPPSLRPPATTNWTRTRRPCPAPRSSGRPHGAGASPYRSRRYTGRIPARGGNPCTPRSSCSPEPGAMATASTR